MGPAELPSPPVSSTVPRWVRPPDGGSCSLRLQLSPPLPTKAQLLLSHIPCPSVLLVGRCSELWWCEWAPL